VTIFCLSRRPRRDHEEHEQFSKSDLQGTGSKEQEAGSRKKVKFLNSSIPQSLNLFNYTMREFGRAKRQPEAATRSGNRNGNRSGKKM